MESSIAVFLKRWEACELPPTNLALHASALRCVSLPMRRPHAWSHGFTRATLCSKKNVYRSWPRRPAESSFESCQQYESCLGSRCKRCTTARFPLAANKNDHTMPAHTRLPSPARRRPLVLEP